MLVLQKNPNLRTAQVRLRGAKATILRSIREFAEQEIILPSGPFQDERFKVSRQPWCGLWFDGIDSGRFRRHALTGVGQGGKTLAGSAIPVMYHLFEHCETTVYGAPTLDMAADKWRQDILPVIQASRYRDLLPDSGKGSKGGNPVAIQFKHGPTLRFMTGGGSDKVRAGFTARAVVVTEVDGMDDSSESSRETDKVNQLESRSNAFGDRARLYLECTASTEDGRIWKELKEGTDSRIAMPCCHCGKFVTPERKHLTGWNEAQNVVEARERSTLCCPACGASWSEDDRSTSNRGAKLVHKGQEITEDGTIVGLMPKTLTLGFRFSAVNNLIVSMARVAEEEYSAPRTTDPESAEKKLRQFYWTLPSEPESVTMSEVDANAIALRILDIPKGRVPSTASKVTVGIDIGKWLCHWVALAWTGGTPHCLEYGRIEVPSAAMAEEHAILTALRTFRDEALATGWPGDSANIRSSLTLVDSGNWESTIVAFCKESGAGYLPTKGFGVNQIGKRRSMREPGYEVVPQDAGHNLVEVNVDHWKSEVHNRLQTPMGQPGALTLFRAKPNEHLSYAKHMTAEKRIEEFIAGRGLVGKWEAVNRNNHYLDATVNALVAGHGTGERLIGGAPAKPDPQPKQPQTSVAPSEYMNRSKRW